MPKEKLLLVGAGGFGRVVSETAATEYELAFVDDGFEVGTQICGVSVVGQIADLETLFGSYRRFGRNDRKQCRAGAYLQGGKEDRLHFSDACSSECLCQSLCQGGRRLCYLKQCRRAKRFDGRKRRFAQSRR